MSGRNNIKKIIIYFLSVSVFLILWTSMARSIDAPLILPPVKDVFVEIIILIKTGSFWIDFSYTLLRVFLSFFISIFLGLFLGLLAGIFPLFRTFIDLPLSFVRSTPVVAIILITLFWFNSSSVPVFVGILMSLPIVVTAVTEGMCKNNKELMFMAEVYNFSSWQKFRYVKLHDLKPFIINAALSVFGLSWKVVVAGEVLCLPKYGFGSLMQTAQVHLETATVIAITVILVICSFSLEKIFMVVAGLIQKKGGKDDRK